MAVHFVWVLFLNAWYVAGSKEERDERCWPRWWKTRLGKVLCYYLWVQALALIKEGCISIGQVARCAPKSRNRMKQAANDAARKTTTGGEQNPDIRTRRSTRAVSEPRLASSNAKRDGSQDDIEESGPFRNVRSNSRPRMTPPSVVERGESQYDIEEGAPDLQVQSHRVDRHLSTRRREEGNAQRKNENLADDMYRRLTPTLFVTSSAADADLALDWVFAAELLRRSRTDIDYKFFVLSAVFSAIGTLLWVLCTFDISGFSGPRPPNVHARQWRRPEHHPFWWMWPKGFLVFVTVLLEDIPQLVITSVVQRTYDPSSLTSFALANIVTSLYAMGLKLVQAFIEQSTYELDIPTTINLANSFEKTDEFGRLLKARQSAEELIEKAMYAFAFGGYKSIVYTGDPVETGITSHGNLDGAIEWEGLSFVLSANAVENLSVLGHVNAEKGQELATAIENTKSIISLKLESTDPEAIQALAVALEKNSRLWDLDLGGNSISDDGAKALAVGLEKHSTLRRLYLGGNSISDDGAKALAAALEKNSTLRNLYLGGNSISDDGAKALAAALEKNSTLWYLYLNGNSISEDGAKAFAVALEKNTRLRSLNLDGNSISDDGAKALAAALEKNSRLWELDLGGNSISEDGAKALAAALNNSTLAWLYLNGNSISDDGAKALAAALEKNSRLWDLDLGGNSISDDGAKALAVALEKNSTLAWLYLNGNSISDDGAKALAVALEKNSTLGRLYLNGNSISDDGAKALAAALEKNSTLEWLNLDGNSISDDGAKALAAALEKNSRLWHLDLGGNSISDNGAKALAVALEKNSTLRRLYLNRNFISDDGAKALAVPLEKNSKNSALEHLDLNGNSISDDGAKALAAALEKNRSP